MMGSLDACIEKNVAVANIEKNVAVANVTPLWRFLKPSIRAVEAVLRGEEYNPAFLEVPYEELCRSINNILFDQGLSALRFNEREGPGGRIKHITNNLSQILASKNDLLTMKGPAAEHLESLRSELRTLLKYGCCLALAGEDEYNNKELPTGSLRLPVERILSKYLNGQKLRVIPEEAHTFLNEGAPQYLFSQRY